MLIQKMDRDHMKQEYNILCQRLYPLTTGLRTPFGSTHCAIEPLGSTAPHHHHEGETFYILDGEGQMRIGAEESPVRAGDVILIPPFCDHVLTNLSTTQAIRFISVYWETPSRLFDTPPPSRVLVFSAPPTPNGDLHLGHLSGPYVAADAYRKFLMLNGIDVSYVTGTDDHQSYVPVKGQAMGLTPTEVIDRFATSIRGTLASIGASPDRFLLPVQTPEYIRFVQDFFLKLLDDGKLEWRETDNLYCESCDLHLYEALVRGQCPVCSVMTNGNGCESCGQTNDCIDLGQPMCNRCDAPATVRRVHKYYFPLSRYRDAIRSHLHRAAMPPLMRKFATDILDSRVPDISVTQIATWGIPVPDRAVAAVGGAGQVMYDWFEMAAGYLYLAEVASCGRGYGHFWMDSQAQVVEFFGFDNSFFYLILNPALLLAHTPSIRLPAAFFINQFYLLDGSKFSTSRRHAVWGDEILAHVPADMVRCYLGFSRSETRQTNFTLADFEDMVSRELVGSWEPLLAEVDAILQPFGETVPAPPAEFEAGCRTFFGTLQSLGVEGTHGYTAGSFSLNQVVCSLCDLVSRTRRFVATQQPLAGVRSMQSAWHGSVVLLAAAIRTLGILSYPILPDFGAHVLQKFGLRPETPDVWRLVGQIGDLHLRPGALHDRRFSTGLEGLRTFMHPLS